MSYIQPIVSSSDKFELINLRRLIKGIIYFSLFFIGAFRMGTEFLYFGETILFLNILVVFTIPYAVVGQYFLRSYHFDYNPVMEPTWHDFLKHQPAATSNRGAFGNIESVLEYRNSMAGSMSTVDATEMFTNTGWIEAAAMRAESGSRMHDSLGYVNSSLNSMSLSDGLSFLSSGKA